MMDFYQEWHVTGTDSVCHVQSWALLALTITIIEVALTLPLYRYFLLPLTPGQHPNSYKVNS